MPILAQMNIARMKLGWEDPDFKDFVDALDPVNASAEASPGFVWRLRTSAEGGPALVDFEQQGWLVNLSAWTSVEALRDFVRSPAHLAIMRRRAEWFRNVEVHLVLWWLADGETPRFEDALARLEHLRAHGPGPEAFDFRHPFGPVQLSGDACYSATPSA